MNNLNSLRNRVNEIDTRLSEIDNETTRPIRALISGYATEKDKEKIKILEREAIELRTEFKKINRQIELIIKAG